MNPAYTQSLNKLIEEFAKLPGIGTKTAERLAFHILRTPKDEAILLADAITKVKNTVGQCKTCHNLSETDTCAICLDIRREKNIICVVEQFKDLITVYGDGKININSAPEEIFSVLGLGPNLIAAIVNYRNDSPGEDGQMDTEDDGAFISAGSILPELRKTTMLSVEEEEQL